MVASAAAVVLVASICAGCTFGPCAEPNIPSPAVWLDASLWLAAHPGGTLRACFAQHCQAIGIERQPVQLVQRNSHVGRPQLLTVSTTGAGAHQLLSQSVALKHITQHGACGAIDYWGLNVRVDGTGRTEVLGWSRRYLQPATTIPTPSPTP